MHLVEALHFDLEFESLILRQVPHSLGEVVDELASTLRPHEVGVGIDLPQLHASLRITYRNQQVEYLHTAFRATLGKSHVRILSVEHVLTALVVLDVAGTERAVQLLRRDAQFLGDLRGGVA